MDAHASHEKNLNINAIQENKNITKYLIVLGKVYLLKKYLKEIVEATHHHHHMKEENLALTQNTSVIQKRKNEQKKIAILRKKTCCSSQCKEDFCNNVRVR